MPSIDKGHSRACVNRCRSRVRSRDASATVRPSAPLHPPLPARRFRVRSRFRLARSPSLPIVTLRAFHAERRPALLWIRLPPIDFCNCNILPMRGHAHEHPILASHPKFRTLADSPSSPSIPQPFHRLRPSPHEEALRELRASTALPTTSPWRCKHAKGIRLRKPSPSLDVACGRRPNPTITCGDGCWTTTLDCTGRKASSEGLSSCAPCCRRNRRREFPSSYV